MSPQASMFEHLVTEISLTTAYGSLSCLVAVKTVRDGLKRF